MCVKEQIMLVSRSLLTITVGMGMILGVASVDATGNYPDSLCVLEPSIVNNCG